MTQRLFLLRHGEVTSHRGDVPVTEEGLQTAVEVGRRLAGRADGAIRVISGETRRTRDTAAASPGSPEAGAEVLEDGVAFALRNPDLYLAGVRVDMVSSEAAFAAQIPGFTEADVAKVEFFTSGSPYPTAWAGGWGTPRPRATTPRRSPPHPDVRRQPGRPRGRHGLHRRDHPLPRAARLRAGRRRCASAGAPGWPGSRRRSAPTAP